MCLRTGLKGGQQELAAIGADIDDQGRGGRQGAQDRYMLIGRTDPVTKRTPEPWRPAEAQGLQKLGKQTRHEPHHSHHRPGRTGGPPAE